MARRWSVPHISPTLLVHTAHLSSKYKSTVSGLVFLFFSSPCMFTRDKIGNCSKVNLSRQGRAPQNRELTAFTIGIGPKGDCEQAIRWIRIGPVIQVSNCAISSAKTDSTLNTTVRKISWQWLDQQWVHISSIYHHTVVSTIKTQSRLPQCPFNHFSKSILVSGSAALLSQFPSQISGPITPTSAATVTVQYIHSGPMCQAATAASWIDPTGPVSKWVSMSLAGNWSWHPWPGSWRAPTTLWNEYNGKRDRLELKLIGKGWGLGIWSELKRCSYRCACFHSVIHSISEGQHIYVLYRVSRRTDRYSGTTMHMRISVSHIMLRHNLSASLQVLVQCTHVNDDQPLSSVGGAWPPSPPQP